MLCCDWSRGGEVEKWADPVNPSYYLLKPYTAPPLGLAMEWF